MKYDTSSIMKSAHGYVRAGLTLKDAMVRAWCEAKIDKLDDARFMLDMKDHWDSEDHQYAWKLNADKQRLAVRIAKTPAEQQAAAEAEKAAAEAQAEWQRQEDARIQRVLDREAEWAAYQKQRFAKMFA